MRWIWIDRFESFQSGKSAVAVKAVTAAEEHLHDLYPGFPVFPASLIIEGMAQTAGILDTRRGEGKTACSNPSAASPGALHPVLPLHARQRISARIARTGQTAL